MPAIAHLAPRFLEDASTGGISGTAIAVLVVVGIIPVFALIWVCIWLLFFYGKGRNCCCMRRKRAASEPQALESPMSSDATLNEKRDYTLPQRPAAAWRNDSGSSTEGPRDSMGTLKKHHPRESIQSQWSSSSTVPVMQEPKQMAWSETTAGSKHLQPSPRIAQAANQPATKPTEDMNTYRPEQ
ncbi:hypothetical protein OPT61_g5206 [Boeremia exigua]|uniref:Uncharacterized protein n=1 Tax=Boeremia exigua TaxID=749465 RepID=A0ACC2IBA8_9PLEO|nr:hypothetical protein OPT61_g5206 [Boeremia exigua]